MASNYTNQFGLCQWEETDAVKRTDFNEDNQKIEAGLIQLKSQLETSSVQLNAQIETSANQLYAKFDNSVTLLSSQLTTNTNQLNTKIDTNTSQLNALIESKFQQVQSQINTQVEKRLADMESQLPSIQGNLYDMLLNRYYSGENLSSRKMLFLDGFKDQSLIAAMTAGVYYDTALKRPKVYAAGAKSVTSTFSVTTGSTGTPGSDGRYCAWLGMASTACTLSTTFTPSGYGTLKSVTMRLSKNNTSVANTTVQVQIYDGTTLVGTSQTATVTSNAYADITFTFSGGLSLLPKEYTVQIENVSKTYYLRVAYTAVDSMKMGVSFTFDPLNCTSGTLTSVTTDLGRGYTGALAWVRHIGGSVDLAVKSAGTAVALTRISTQASATYKGETCTESVFQLPARTTALNRQVAVQLTPRVDSSGCILCDYGVTFF